MYKMAPTAEVVNPFTEVPCGTCKVSSNGRSECETPRGHCHSGISFTAYLAVA